MSKTQHDLEKICDVLSCLELTIGRNCVEVLDIGNDLEKKVKLFSINTLLTDRSIGTRELVIIPHYDCALEQAELCCIQKLLELDGNYHRVYILENGRDISCIGLVGSLIKIISTETFHDLLVQLPSKKKLTELLLDEGETRNREQIDKLYQTRTAVLRYEPMEREATLERTAPLDDHLRHWAHSQNPSSPIMLLGERGSGKTWQLLRFCQEQNLRHSQNKWAYGPAFLIKLRTFRDFSRNANRCLPALTEYLLQHYPGLSFHQDFAMMSALQSTGHLVLCLDGLDEMDLQANDFQVQEALSNLANALPIKAKFIISCRGAHFRSLDELLSLRVLPDKQVKDIFQILYLLPFDLAKQECYLSTVRKLHPHAFQGSIDQIFGQDTDPLERSIRQALRVAGRHPILLHYLVERLREPKVRPEPLEILRGMIEEALIQANLQEERTSPEFLSGELETEEVVALAKPERLAICQEIAWMLAERGHEDLDFTKISDKIRFFYQITSDALERDIRSQTVFQHPDYQQEMSPELGTTLWGSRTVLFTLRFESMEKCGGRVSETSVTGAYFSARYIFERLTEKGPFGPLGLDHGLRFLGRVPLGPVAGAMLMAMLREYGLGTNELAEAALKFMVRLLKKSRYGLFTPWCRYLLSNLLDMRCVTPRQAEQLDPWTVEIGDLLSSPSRLPEYPMVLIPGEEPVLLGVHEVTNENYAAFIQSEQGQDWAVKHMTRAASGKDVPPSPFYKHSNEYHLYYWEKQGGSGNFMPPQHSLKHPVTWVSWYAAAVFCNWLSDGDAREKRYLTPFGYENPNPTKHSERSRASYRLPTVSEWTAAAKGGHDDLVYPWDMFPYHLEAAQRDLCRKASIDRDYGKVEDKQALKNYIKRQNVMERMLVRASREARPVMYDEFNDFGISGLIGNVKEWCEDWVPSHNVYADAGKIQKSQTPNSEPPDDLKSRVILGASAYLDENSFRFDYKSDLFPQNTNPDIGFRVARSLKPAEMRELNARLEEITNALCIELKSS